ncbi:hypothetical protein A499_24764 [Niallia nealsonii AAU1]|nr:hypothetical protein A499_24764 [Niallia nealsonii AAU1]
MNFKRNLVPQMASQGWHIATVNDVREGKPAKTKRGYSDTALINFTTENHCLVTQSFLMAQGVNFLLEKLIDITMGEGDEEIELENLGGMRCGIKVEHRLWNDRVFANVVDVCSIDELQKPGSNKSAISTQVIKDLDDLDII